MTAQERRGRRRGGFAKLLLVVLILTSSAAAFWFGLVPQRLNPFPRLVLSEPDPWFVDFRLAALRGDRDLCSATLIEPQITARPVDDKKIENGCGWVNAVRMSAAGGADFPVGTITCEMAAGLALWLEHDIQPLAQKLLGAKVIRIVHMGGYSCRNIIGSKALTSFRSQHATANAIDIAGFQLGNGRTVRVARDWTGNGAASEFLRQAHRTACHYFRIALSPNFNAAHHDHFHFDRGPFVRCK